MFFGDEELAQSLSGLAFNHPRRRILLLPALSIFLCALAQADEPSDEMVVEAERVAGVDPGQTSASVTVIAVDETLSAGADLGSVVESASGTVVRRLGGLGDYSSVSIRGSSSRQVQVYLDGIPLNPDGTESINLAELPLSSAEASRALDATALPRSDPSTARGAAELRGSRMRRACRPLCGACRRQPKRAVRRDGRRRQARAYGACAAAAEAAGADA